MSRAYVQNIYLRRVDFSALDADAFVVAVGCRGVQSLTVRGSFIPSGLVTDALLRSCAASGLVDLRFFENESDAPHRFSEDALLDFFFAAGASTKGRHRNLELQGEGITATFVRKLFERLRTTSVRPSGNLEFYVPQKQRGLSAYEKYLTPGMHDTVLHRFPPTDDSYKSYAVGFYVKTTWMHVWFRPE
ncbi:hypothetical protein AAVH_24653 [Aphelenchoides avenae]|nr:hypothetical protein AAVH_24653 [Aphelenchus avenae]